MATEKFERWLAAVDRGLCRLAGMSHKDLPDIPWRELWASGMSASQTTRKVLIDTFGSL